MADNPESPHEVPVRYNMDCPARCTAVHDVPILTRRYELFTCPETDTEWVWCDFGHTSSTRTQVGRGEWVEGQYEDPIETTFRGRTVFLCSPEEHDFTICADCGNPVSCFDVFTDCYDEPYCGGCWTGCNCSDCNYHEDDYDDYDDYDDDVCESRGTPATECGTCKTLNVHLCLETEEYVCKCSGERIVAAGGQVHWLVAA